MGTQLSPGFLRKALVEFAQQIRRGEYTCEHCKRKWNTHTRAMRCYANPDSTFFTVRSVFLNWAMEEVRGAIERESMNMIDATGLSTREIFYWQVCKNCNTYWQEHDHMTGKCLFVPNSIYELPDAVRPAGVTAQQIVAALQAFK